jgi:hypothetical protein
MREAVDTLSQTEDFLLPWIVAESELKALAENHDENMWRKPLICRKSLTNFIT